MGKDIGPNKKAGSTLSKMRQLGKEKIYLPILRAKERLLGKKRKGGRLSILFKRKKRVGSTKDSDNSFLASEFGRCLSRRNIKQIVKRAWSSSQERSQQVERLLRKLAPRKSQDEATKRRAKEADERITRIMRWIEYGRRNGAFNDFVEFLQKIEIGAIENMSDITLRDHKKFSSGEWAVWHSAILNVVSDIRNWFNRVETNYQLRKAKNALRNSKEGR